MKAKINGREIDVDDAIELYFWMKRFFQVRPDRKYTNKEMGTATDHFLADIDPIKSAEAICEGRTIELSS